MKCRSAAGCGSTTVALPGQAPLKFNGLLAADSSAFWDNRLPCSALLRHALKLTQIVVAVGVVARILRQLSRLCLHRRLQLSRLLLQRAPLLLRQA